MAYRRPDIGEVNDHFRVAMKFNRLWLGLTLQQLSEKLTAIGYPMTKGMLSQIESGHRRVLVDEFAALTYALDMYDGASDRKWITQLLAIVMDPVARRTEVLEAAENRARMFNISLAESLQQLYEMHEKLYRGSIDLAMSAAERRDEDGRAFLGGGLEDRRVAAICEALLAEMAGGDG